MCMCANPYVFSWTCPKTVPALHQQQMDEELVFRSLFRFGNEFLLYVLKLGCSSSFRSVPCKSLVCIVEQTEKNTIYHCIFLKLGVTACCWVKTRQYRVSRDKHCSAYSASVHTVYMSQKAQYFLRF